MTHTIPGKEARVLREALENAQRDLGHIEHRLRNRSYRDARMIAETARESAREVLSSTPTHGAPISEPDHIHEQHGTDCACPKCESAHQSPSRAAGALKRFADDVQDVQSRIVIVHQLRASADIQDAATKRETGWADTSDRAQLMRRAADTIEALATPQTIPAENFVLVPRQPSRTDFDKLARLWGYTDEETAETLGAILDVFAATPQTVPANAELPGREGSGQ